MSGNRNRCERYLKVTKIKTTAYSSHNILKFMQTATRACHSISHKMPHRTVQRVQRLIDHTHLAQLYSCCDNRLPSRYLKPKLDKCVLVIIFAFKKHGKNDITGRIPLGMPPHKGTTIKVFHSVPKKKP